MSKSAPGDTFITSPPTLLLVASCQALIGGRGNSRHSLMEIKNHLLMGMFMVIQRVAIHPVPYL